MKNRENVIWAIVYAGLALGLSVAPAAAQTVAPVTVTFSSTVRIPGDTLPPGTYKFQAERMSNGAGRMVIRDARDRFVTSAGVTLVQRPQVGSTTVSFVEPRLTPPQVSLLFARGSTLGFEFTYPHETSGRPANAGHLASVPAERVAERPVRR